MNLKDAITAAQAADDAFELAVRASGFKSRWDWNQHLVPGPEALRAAYRNKVTADNAMHAAFEASRAGPAPAHPFKLHFTNMGYGPEATFATVRDAVKAGIRYGFEFTVCDQHGIVTAWSPIGGERAYRALTAAGELRQDSPR